MAEAIHWSEEMLRMYWAAGGQGAIQPQDLPELLFTARIGRSVLEVRPQS